ncbi:DUF4256 domain-containing protein [Flavobacterium sp. MAH-1]|uniref:DUF4256 domain-containing protein n=1 Tax=Flavobacterium agri TaxID=2743471 RepID=A0A7Y8Y263_9FLAO|nr:DUF4256 domain-containing protein [Flavobacterium agri]NUY79835.1 DUF4256 domain-containing protein [Flavobacterium agri]NYA69860.1 DUF4256 domain-containing protein [Flavobacterium agri]
MNTLSASQQKEFIEMLQTRFEKNIARHKGLEWAEIQRRLESDTKKLWALFQMEQTEGEPDVIGIDEKTNEFLFVDCCAESPKGRRSICYDQAALEARKEHKPANSAMNLAKSMGVEILTEEEYRLLQQLGKFDLKTSSWVKTPDNIRKLGGAVFCDRRYDTVFLYHNGADSYYAARGFRAIVRV